jgi:hypothetical protein
MRRVSSLLIVPLVLGSAALSGGCSTMSNTEKGVGIGGALGAGVGTLVGAATGNPKTGAVVGGLLGAGTGGLIGADADAQERREQRVMQAQAAQAQAQAIAASQMNVNDIIAMASSQPPVGDSVIISQIRNTGSSFQLSTADITMLKQNNVSDAVITEMINARPRTVVTQPRTVVVAPASPPPVVVYERPYWGPRYYWGPPPPVGIGFTYIRR